MNASTLVLKNLTRNPMRSVLTLAAVAFPMVMFVTVSALVDVFGALVANAGKQLRIAVHNRLSLAQPLPERLMLQIRGLDPEGLRIRAMCGLAFLRGKVEDAPPFEFPSIAADPEGWPEVFSEYGLSGAERVEWLKTRSAACVGIATAEHYGWSAGQEVELRSSVAPYMRMRFRIIKVTDKGPNPAMFWCRRDYLDEERKRLNTPPGWLNMIWIKCNDPAAMERLAGDIDESTRNTLNETQTESESQFFAGMIRTMGALPSKVAIVAYAMVAAIVMMVANTMSLTFRERIRELAAMKALGFSPAWLARLVMAESLTLAVIGGAVGILPAYLLTQMVPVTLLQGYGPMKRFVISGNTAAFAFVVAVLVGLAAGLVPAIQAARLRVVKALRKVA